MLPPALANVCKQYENPIHRDVYLLSVITIFGSSFDNYYTQYAGRKIRSNLFLYISDPQGIADNSLEQAKIFADDIEDERIQFTIDYKKDYPDDLREYEEKLRLFLRKQIPTRPKEPPVPKEGKHYISTGISAAMLMLQLRENNGLGLLLESGAAVGFINTNLIEWLKKLLPKALLNNSTSYYHTSAKEEIRLDHPAFSLLLSGSNEDILHMIPGENSPLLKVLSFYKTPDDVEYNPFSTIVDIDQDNMFGWFVDIYILLWFIDEPLHFAPGEQQQQEMWQQCGRDKYLTLLCLRIAMILEIINYNREYLERNNTITCSDNTLQCAIAIAKVIQQHNLVMYEYIKEHGRQPVQPGDEQFEQQIRELHEKGMSVRKIAAEVFGDESKFMRVQRIVK